MAKINYKRPVVNLNIDDSIKSIKEDGNEIPTNESLVAKARAQQITEVINTKTDIPKYSVEPYLYKGYLVEKLPSGHISVKTPDGHLIKDNFLSLDQAYGVINSLVKDMNDDLGIPTEVINDDIPTLVDGNQEKIVSREKFFDNIPEQGDKRTIEYFDIANSYFPKNIDISLRDILLMEEEGYSKETIGFFKQVYYDTIEDYNQQSSPEGIPTEVINTSLNYQVKNAGSPNQSDISYGDICNLICETYKKSDTYANSVKDFCVSWGNGNFNEKYPNYIERDNTEDDIADIDSAKHYFIDILRKNAEEIESEEPGSVKDALKSGRKCLDIFIEAYNSFKNEYSSSSKPDTENWYNDKQENIAKLLNWSIDSPLDIHNIEKINDIIELFKYPSSSSKPDTEECINEKMNEIKNFCSMIDWKPRNTELKELVDRLKSIDQKHNC